MITYVLKSGNYYKIGRTNDLKRRIKQYETHNPIIELICSIDCDCEYYLHYRFKDKVIKNEWFLLTDEDITFILTNTDLLHTFSYENLFDYAETHTDELAQNFMTIAKKRQKFKEYEMQSLFV